MAVQCHSWIPFAYELLSHLPQTLPRVLPWDKVRCDLGLLTPTSPSSQKEKQSFPLQHCRHLRQVGKGTDT